MPETAYTNIPTTPYELPDGQYGIFMRFILVEIVYLGFDKNNYCLHMQ
jgi:hypothetical protein